MLRQRAVQTAGDAPFYDIAAAFCDKKRASGGGLWYTGPVLILRRQEGYAMRIAFSELFFLLFSLIRSLLSLITPVGVIVIIVLLVMLMQKVDNLSKKQ